MKTVSPPDAWVVRLLRMGSLLSAGAAVVVWVAPVNAPGRNLVPVGCGAPSSPSLEPLTDFVCADHIAIARSTALALITTAAVLLVISELVLPQVAAKPWVRAVAAAATVAVPVLALSTATLFSTVAGTAADGTLIRCGTPVAPSADPISRSVCGQLAARDKVIGLGGVCLSVLALVGAGYVARGRPEVAFDGSTPGDSSTGESPSDAGPAAEDDAAPVTSTGTGAEDRS